MNKYIKKIIILGSLLAVVSGGYYWHQASHTSIQKQQQETISEFNQTRDLEPILELFKDNWYWLIASKPYYSHEYAEYFFTHRAPDRNPEHQGILQIDVLYEGDQFAGFTAYYLESQNVGDLLFVAVKKEFRGKQYGQKLTRHAIDALLRMGAQRVHLVTRTSNFAAQRIYKRAGFQETYRDNGYVYFEYIPVHA